MMNVDEIFPDSSISLLKVHQTNGACCPVTLNAFSSCLRVTFVGVDFDFSNGTSDIVFSFGQRLGMNSFGRELDTFGKQRFQLGAMLFMACDG